MNPKAALVAAGVLGMLPRVAAAQSGPASPTVRLDGELQVRWVAVSSTSLVTPNDVETGFQLRRARLVVTGALPDRRFTWRVRPAYDRANNTVALDDAWVAFRSGMLRVQAGQFKPQFLREENVTGFLQLAVERSYAADYYTLDYTQGVELGIEQPRWRASAAVHDGSYGQGTDLDADRTSIAAAGRAELRVGQADWSDFRDFSAWAESRQPTAESRQTAGLMLGAALDVERGMRRAARLPSVTRWTVDVTGRAGPVSAFASVTGQLFDAPDTAGGIPAALDGASQRAVVAQLGVFALPARLEVFGRGEWLRWDGVYYRNSAGSMQNGSRALAARELRMVTAGFNLYVHRDAAKLSLDVVIAADPVPVANTGGGLLRSDGSRQTAVRTQWQLRF